jgi:hypothetical protein
MHGILVLAAAVSVTMQPVSRENLIHIKSCKVTLSPDWIVCSHIPNGSEISLVSVILADSIGLPQPDKSMLLYGFCDVSTHAGLTKKHLITANHKGKTAKQIGEWELSYVVEAKRTDYGLVIDAFRYLEDRKAYLWVRRGRMVKEADYIPTEADYSEFAPYLKRIVADRAP